MGSTITRCGVYLQQLHIHCDILNALLTNRLSSKGMRLIGVKVEVFVTKEWLQKLKQTRKEAMATIE